MDLHIFQSETSFTHAATDFIAAYILNATTQKKRASIFLSGGSTPGPIYERISSYDLPWQHIDIGLVDERWVDEASSGSNAALIRKTLMRNKAKHTNFLVMKSKHNSAKDGQRTINTAYAPLFKSPSLAILGMGPDGHTASWFSNADGLAHALDKTNSNVVQAIMAPATPVTGTHLERMTLTRNAFEKCQSLLLLTKGADKRAVLEKALNNIDPELPISILIAALKDRLTILHLEN